MPTGLARFNLAGTIESLQLQRIRFDGTLDGVQSKDLAAGATGQSQWVRRSYAKKCLTTLQCLGVIKVNNPGAIQQNLPGTQNLGETDLDSLERVTSGTALVTSRCWAIEWSELATSFDQHWPMPVPPTNYIGCHWPSQWTRRS